MDPYKIVTGLLAYSSAKSLENIEKQLRKESNAVSSRLSSQMQDLRRKEDENSRKMQEAIRQQDKRLVELIEIEQQQADVQLQQLQSQLRQEEAIAMQQMHAANEEKIVVGLFEIVEEAKQYYRKKDYYGCLLCSFNALHAYKRLLASVELSDNKLKISKLHSEAYDIAEMVLTESNIPQFVAQVKEIASGLRALETSIAAIDIITILEKSKSKLDSINPSLDPASVDSAVSDLDELYRELEGVQDKLNKSSEVIEQAALVLAPLSIASSEFFKSQEQIIQKVISDVNASTGANVDSAVEFSEEISLHLAEIETLKSQVSQRKLVLQEKLLQRMLATYRSRIKRSTRIFYLVMVLGFLATVLVGILVGQKEGEMSPVFPYYLVGIVIYWFILRSKRKKVKAEIGL